MTLTELLSAYGDLLIFALTNFAIGFLAFKKMQWDMREQGRDFADLKTHVAGLDRRSQEGAQALSGIADLKSRVSHLEMQGQASGQALAGIAATLTSMQETLREIKLEMRGKADK